MAAFRVHSKWQALAVVGSAELLAMTLWFSATAVGPELADRWQLTPIETAWLTMAVQLGFVVGALLLAGSSLADVVEPKYLFAGSAALGAAVTTLLAVVVDSASLGIPLRFVTGVALAGVYPTGMKMMAAWFHRGRGLAIGVLVGALTIGSATPHLIRVIGGIGNPNVVLVGSATLAGLAAIVVLGYDDGPYQVATAPFDPHAIGRILRDRPTMLANLGYFGHMWELYAVWTWIPAYLASSLATSGVVDPAILASLLAFGTIAIGGPGAWMAGWGSDRWGRTTVTSSSMVASGTACIVAGLVYGARLPVVGVFVLLWGFVIVADSAQFSAAVSELADGRYVGSALTFQTAVGFFVTIVSIQLVPVFRDLFTWQWAFAPLAIGPIVGTVSMLWLRSLPEGKAMAGGRG